MTVPAFTIYLDMCAEKRTNGAKPEAGHHLQQSGRAVSGGAERTDWGARYAAAPTPPAPIEGSLLPPPAPRSVSNAREVPGRHLCLAHKIPLHG